MPIDYQSIRSQIKSMAGWDQVQQEHRNKVKCEALENLGKNSDNADGLKNLIEQAKSRNSNLRCAVPTSEQLDCCYSTPQEPEGVVLLAADGSQIFPDRNDPFNFGLINVGAIRFQPGSDQNPVEMRESRLLFGDDLYDSQGNALGEEVIALKRDYEEREFLSSLAIQESNPVVALTDGPLEFYLEPRLSADYQTFISNYQELLYQLSLKEIITAGYIDRPRSNLVIRLLELAHLEAQNLPLDGRNRPFIFLTDAELFAEILKPGTRSAIFGIESPSTGNTKKEVAIHFFYLNVGRSASPIIARVEIPAWVGQNLHALDGLQGVLLEQCSQMGGNPYPYLLYRAHEIALVKRIDKDELIQLMAEEFYRLGIPVAGFSSKQHHKNLDTTRRRVNI